MRREIETIAEFDEHLRVEQTLAGCMIQALDLRGRGEVLRNVPVQNAFFLGCRLKHRDASSMAQRGAAIFPRLPQLPFDAYRPALYTPEEMFAGLESGYARTPDARIYAWTLRERSHLLDATLAQSLHDHFVTDALLDAVTEPGAAIGVMGGHSVVRGSDGFRHAAQLGHRLAEAGHLVITGGGPGAMEAANLGASLRGTLTHVDAACAFLAGAPTYTPDAGAWASTAFEAKRRWDCTRQTIGIPTWHYGHEPPNAFATRHAKYFDNAIREDILLRLSGAGLVYMPGSAGTTQEVFQAVTRNYYALEHGELRPMVLVGREYWIDVLPVWPLLSALARGRMMEAHVHVVDTIDEVLGVLDA